MLTLEQALALVIGEFGQDRPFTVRDLLCARHPVLQEVGLAGRPFRYVLSFPHGGLVLVREGGAKAPLTRRRAGVADKLESIINNYQQ